jgi:ATP-dependent Clp protease ATP-binding subunit ClpA
MKIFSIFICGDSGIGKTEIARIIHNSLYKHSVPIKINLGNYKTQGALNSLIGSPKGYYGSERGGELSNKIRKSDTKVILIDEFEKADTDIFNFFYELLEDGKFTDLDENEYDLNGYLIIFTTNLKKNDYMKTIPAHLASRFTMIYEFDKLSATDKYSYIKYRVNVITEKYNKEFRADLKSQDLLKAVLSYNISSINNLRELNRYIHRALIELATKKATKH